MEESRYWNIDASRSYSALFNFIVGPRGVGKTYALKKYVINRFIKRGEQFVYLRRRRNEMKEGVGAFFNDIREEFPGHQLKVDKGKFWIDGALAGYFVILSTSDDLKSVPYPLVETIIFDEFIIGNRVHRYLPGEVTTFSEFYSTVARGRDVTVYFLANSHTWMNPYFSYYGIDFPYGKTISCKDDKLVEVVKSPVFESWMKETRFGKLMRGTEYASYSIDNEFVADKSYFIAKKPARARHLCCLSKGGKSYGYWIDYAEDISYVSEDCDTSCKFLIAVDVVSHRPGIQLDVKGNTIFQRRLIRDFNRGALRFETLECQLAVQEFVNRHL